MHSIVHIHYCNKHAREASDQKVALQPLVPICHREILFLGDCIITAFCDF